MATSYITNATLAQQITDLVNKWNTRELQMRVWLAGTATGGDFGNGTYPLTNYLNAVSYVASPAAMASGVSGSSTAAAASAAAALVSQNAANASAVAALASQNAAGTSATNAAASASTATTQASTAIGAQTNATNQAAIATAAALSASTSAQTAHIIYAEAEPGDEGPMGPTGRVGDTGPIGLRGPPGDDGVQGDDGLSISGPQGIQGPQGSIGMAGYDGDAGDDGMPGPQGLTGPPGPQGSVGLAGFDGDTGEEGLPGPQGLTGLTGAQGFSTFGIAGLDGDQGEEGMPIPGPTGPQGPQGLVGPAASSGFEILFNEITQEDDSFPGIPSNIGPLTVNGQFIANGRAGIGTVPDSTLHVVSGNTAGLRVGYNGTSANYYDADTQYFRNGAQTVNNVIISSTGLSTGGAYGRTASGKGYLTGGYPGVETTTSAGCIYTIDSAYPPGTTTLGNMYGIGYTFSNATLITGVTGVPASRWGMYVVANGIATIWMDATVGTGYFASGVVVNSKNCMRSNDAVITAAGGLISSQAGGTASGGLSGDIVLIY